MEELTLAQLANEIEYRELDNGGLDAYLFERLFGSCSSEVVRNKTGVAYWKEELLKNVAHLSTTVIMQTACGCTNYKDGVKQKDREIRVPLLTRNTSYRQELALEYIAPNVRVFKYRGGKDKTTGCRLYEEFL